MATFNGEAVIVEIDGQDGMRLSVNRQGKVVVGIGRRDKEVFTEERIQAFVNRHKRFLNNRINRIRNLVQVTAGFEDGTNVTLLGKQYKVRRNENITYFSIEGDTLCVPLHYFYLQSQYFFGNMLEQYVKTLADLYSDHCWINYSRVSTAVWRTAWGKHYNRDNSLSFNIALVLVPEECVEYVVVHELCHSLQQNHSPKFWADVERILPDYKQRKEKLDTYDLNGLLEFLHL